MANRKPSQKQLDALKPTQWKPGQTGNAGGRPKKLPITDALRKRLGELVEGDKKGRTFDELMADLLINMVLTGSKKLEAVREILDRVEGRAVQRTELSGPDGGSVHFETPGSRDEAERRIRELLSGAKPK